MTHQVEVVTPTAMQRRVLNRLRAAHHRLHGILVAAESGSAPMNHTEYAALEAAISAHNHLLELARAGGVAPEWIAAMQSYAERGGRWMQYRAVPVGRVYRDSLLTAVSADVSVLREMTALNARHGVLGAREDPRLARQFDHAMTDIRSYALVITRLLRLDRDEMRQVWTRGPREWIGRGAAMVRDLDDDTARTAWITAARRDTGMYRRRVHAAASAGVHPLDATTVRTSNADLTRDIRTALARAADIESVTGPASAADAGTAIAAANLTGTAPHTVTRADADTEPDHDNPYWVVPDTGLGTAPPGLDAAERP
ncbi:hypothetical protein IU469_30095 [Nocardia puris]|uniref:hypothetical protein n=1 Tax=Nocardia puris TaxID=208602 RepID=UPI00189345B3|nr:hypothetical protein [Nocardia puris]MBF6369932.1 hypothetical protein [Nocardia puris]